MPSIYDDNLQPLKLDKVKTYPLASRKSKVKLDDFAKPISDDASLDEFLASLPNVLAVQSLRELVERMHRARELKKPIIWGIGGHVIKTGLAPLIIDLMKRGYVSGIAANGSVLVHDSEIAMIGSTSEDVDATLSEGEFGGAEETGQLLNGAALGTTTHTDFRLLAELVRRMDGGGVYLNVGSAVVLPEVFLKCVTLVRNLGHRLSDITTANFDFIQSYRPLTNVVRRPTEGGAGRGFSITGHHELTIPLLAGLLTQKT